MTFFAATTLMTVNLIEITFYICALFTSPPGMPEVGIRLISSVQHLYFIGRPLRFSCRSELYWSTQG